MTSSSSRLRAGIAGFGVVGKRRHAVLLEMETVDVVAVCDRTFDSDGVFSDGVRYYQSYHQLLDEKLDILFVCLTNDVLTRVTIAGLQRNMHVFCEKPPGQNPQQVEDVIAVERGNPHLKLKYGFNHRYHDSVREALKMIRSGTLGDIMTLRGVYGKSMMTSYDSDWRTNREIAGGGILLDQGIHMVDMFRLFGGEFTKISSIIRNEYWGHSVEDNAFALMETDAGVVGMLHSSATEWRHRFRLEIGLTHGALVLAGILSGTKSYGRETLTVVSRGESDQGTPRDVKYDYIEDNSWRDEIYDFIEAIQNDRSIRTGSSADALATINLVFDIYRADETWRSKFDI